MILGKYVDSIINNKNIIINNWVINKEVENIFYQYHVNIDKFIEKYAPLMIEFYVQVINNKNEDEKYKNIDTLLVYFKTKCINTYELFTVFKCFKNNLIDFFETSEDIMKIEKEIHDIFESNFSDLLKRFVMDETYIENRLNHFFNIINESIIMSSTDNKGIITHVTDAFCKVSGYDKKELIGQSHSLLSHPDMDSFTYKVLWETIESGKTWQGEIKDLKKNGDFFWSDIKIEPIFDNDKNIIGYDALRQDITPRKLLQEQQAVLIQQSKSSAMGEMISLIAHQWRQPLQAISILVQKIPLTKMIEGEITDELVEKVLVDVNAQLTYMSKTIDDFRDFFKPNKRKIKVKISTVVEDVLEFLSYMIEIDSITVNTNAIEDSIVEIHVNELKQVIINIIKNARDIMIENKIDQRILNIKYYVDGTKAVLEMEDNAGGIPKSVIEKIFEPYFSTKTDDNGTGLGLYMSKTIIEDHCSGKISASNSNLGAVFKIELPLQLI